MREDLCNDGGVLDSGDQLHPTSAARTVQDIQVEGAALGMRSPADYRANATLCFSR